MEILLLIGVGVLVYVLWKRSRGEPVNAGGIAGGCLGLGCLGLVLLFLAGVVVVWLLLQGLADIDISLNDFFESRDRQGREQPGRLD